MSEAALRLLDRDLPRVDMYNPAFRRRVLDARKREAAETQKAAWLAETALRNAERENRRSEEIAMALALRAENERLRDKLEQIQVERDRAVKRVGELSHVARYEAQLAEEGIQVEPRIPAIDIIKDIALRSGMSVARIRGPSRTKPLVAVRHEAMAAVHLARPDLSLPALGRIFHRDHTTLIFALRKMGVKSS